MNIQDYIKDGKAYFWKEKFAIIKSKKSNSDAFANIIDQNEITVIIDQSKITENDVIEIKKDWKILTFDMVLPFELTGFMAEVSKSLAAEKIAIFVVTAYSTDHILVNEGDMPKTKEKLEELGFIIEER